MTVNELVEVMKKSLVKQNIGFDVGLVFAASFFVFFIFYYDKVLEWSKQTEKSNILVRYCSPIILITSGVLSFCSFSYYYTSYIHFYELQEENINQLVIQEKTEEIKNVEQIRITKEDGHIEKLNYKINHVEYELITPYKKVEVEMPSKEVDNLTTITYYKNVVNPKFKSIYKKFKKPDFLKEKLEQKVIKLN